MALLVDAYAVALRALDPTAWAVFVAVRERVLQSAAALLGHLEVVALRPAVCTDGRAATRGAHEEAVRATAVADVAHHLNSVLRVRVLTLPTPTSTAMTPLSSSSASTRLAADLTRLRAAHAGAAAVPPPPRSDESNGAALVLFQLSDPCVGFLVVSALWMSTKFWATVSESSTLCGLVAGLLRLAAAPSPPHSRGRHAGLSGNAEGEGPRTRGAEGADGVVGLASTPPPKAQLPTAASPSPSQPQPQPQRAGSRGPPVVLGHDGCRSTAPDGCDDDAPTGGAACGALEQLTWLDGDIAADAEAVVRDVEEAEMMLLRCSDYAIPL